MAWCCCRRLSLSRNIEVGAGGELFGDGWLGTDPDKLDDDEQISSRGPFVASFIAFFIAEVGDKTQIATSILGAQYPDALTLVILGTTIGMLLANVPVVLIGKLSADKMPLDLIRKITALLFIALATAAAVFQ